jgi:hypothetical protein
MTVFATHVMLSTGGHQEQPDLGSKAFNNKVMLSDHVLAGMCITIDNSVINYYFFRRYNRTTRKD